MTTFRVVIGSWCVCCCAIWVNCLPIIPTIWSLIPMGHSWTTTGVTGVVPMTITWCNDPSCPPGDLITPDSWGLHDMTRLLMELSWVNQGVFQDKSSCSLSAFQLSSKLCIPISLHKDTLTEIPMQHLQSTIKCHQIYHWEKSLFSVTKQSHTLDVLLATT